MTNKYTVLKTFKLNKWQPFSPVKIVTGQLVLDNFKNDVLLQVKMLSLATINIKAVYLDINILNDNDEILDAKKDIAYLGLDVSPKEYFGDKTPIYLSTTKSLNVEIIVVKVIFSDDSVWVKEDRNLPMIVPEQRPLLKSDEFYNQIKREFKDIDGLSLYYYEPRGSYWMCSCGVANPTEYEKCSYCNIERIWLEEHLNEDYLKRKEEEYNKLQVYLKAKEEETLKEKKENEEKNKALKELKKKKILKLLALLGIVIAILTLLAFGLMKIYASESLTKLVSEKNKEKIEEVLKLGRDINEIDENNQTALSIAVSESDEEMVAFLIKNGADASLKYSGEETVADLVFKNNDYEMLSEMISLSAIKDTTTLASKDNLLHAAVKNNDSKMVDFLIEEGMNTSTLNYEEKTPLQIAIEKNYKEVIDVLFNNYAEATITETKTLYAKEVYDGIIIYSKGKFPSVLMEARIETTYRKSGTAVSIYIGDYRFEGDFDGSSITGEGRVYNQKTNHLIYSGGFKDGMYHGYGKYYWNDSHKVLYEGTFENGRLIRYTRYYQDGTLNDTGTVDEYGNVTSSKYGYKQAQ